MKEFLLENWISLATFIVGFFAWLSERYKRKNIEVDTSQKIISMYKGALGDFEKLNNSKFSELNTKMESMQREIIEWKKKYLNLKKEFESYKQKHP